MHHGVETEGPEVHCMGITVSRHMYPWREHLYFTLAVSVYMHLNNYSIASIVTHSSVLGRVSAIAFD